MDTETAAALSDAMARLDHPRLDWRTEEAKSKTAWMVKHLPKYLRAGGTLLDLGCGCGKHTFQAEQLGLRATGLDCSPGMVGRAVAIADALGSATRYVVADYCRTPFASEAFDYVLFPKNIVECSYEEYERLLVEVCRLLSDGGLYFLTLRDGIERAAGSSSESGYVALTGGTQSQITLPGQGEHAYPTWLWVVPFANYLTSKYLELVAHESLDDRGGMLLVYRKHAAAAL